VLVLERLEHARARGARPLAELLGAGASCDAHHMTAPDPRGQGAARAIRAALHDAALGPDAVTFVNAHGTGTPQNDTSEWHALLEVFGARAAALPLTSTKAAVGHLLGSAGALEAVATVQCLQHRSVHTTHGEGVIDPECSVDLVVDSPRELPEGAIALSTNLAFGGANAALLLGAMPETGTRASGASRSAAS
jgi:3-oxoacyl-[acyl-carrier-protein] synthase II